MKVDVSLHSFHSHSEAPNPAKPSKQTGTPPSVRWLLLMSISVAYMIGTISLDMPSSLQSYFLTDKDFSLNSVQFSLMFSLIGIVSFFFSIFSGIIIDINGDDNGLLIASVMLNIGQLLFTFGLHLRKFALMLFSRILLGLGAEMIPDQINVMAPVWFRNNEISFAYGVAVSFSLIGLILAQTILPGIYLSTGDLFFPSLYVYFITCFALFLCLAVYFGENYYVRRDYDETPLIIVEKNFWNSTKEVFTNVKTMDAPFVSFILSGAIFIAVFQIYLANDNDILAYGWKIDGQVAGYYITFSYVVNLIASPFLGYWIDKIKGYTFFIILSYGLMIIAFLLFSFLTDGYSENFSLIPLFLVGLANAIFRSSYYCSLADTVKKMHLHSTTCGIITSVQYLLSGLFNPVYGAIKDHTKGKTYEALSCFSLLICMLLVGLILLVYSWGAGNEQRVGVEEPEISSFGEFDIQLKGLDVKFPTPRKESMAHLKFVKYSDFYGNSRKISNLKKISFM
jgi:MFS family permease